MMDTVAAPVDMTSPTAACKGSPSTLLADIYQFSPVMAVLTEGGMLPVSFDFLFSDG